jgi:hypothetical protein
MIKRLIPMARKVFGLFVDDGSLALSILVWIFALHVAARIFVDHAWAAPVLFLGCVGILIENVLRESRQALPFAEPDRHIGTRKR